MSDAYEHLLAAVRDIGRLAAIGDLLEWDQDTHMPKKGVAGRAEMFSLVATLKHDRLASPELKELLGRLEDEGDGEDGVRAANVREVRRLHRRATRVPRALVEEIARTTATARGHWAEARERNDFSRFAPSLTRLVDLKRREADAVGFSGHRYDALLDEYEPGASTATVGVLFAELKRDLVPLVQELVDAPVQPDRSLLRGRFPRGRQEEMVGRLVAEIGFDLEAGRLDVSVHPFCVGIHARDVRITTRYDEGYLPSALFGAVHESGHALYEQGLDPEHAFTPAGMAVSCAIHESQSRLWENMVARSRPFWERHYPSLQGLFPEALSDVDLDTFHAAVNAVAPSPIRVEADDVTYNLHILLRFELEQALLDKTLSVGDLPEAWNDGMERLVGVRPVRDAQGCLQDIHWAVGAFGYFPTYALGNLYAAQLHATAREALPDLDDRIAAGDLAPLREWLRDNVHRHGMRYRAAHLCERVTGQSLSVKPFMDYVRARFRPLYGLTE